MSKLSAVLKPSLYCGLALYFFMSLGINSQTQAEEASESATSTKAEKTGAHSTSTGNASPNNTLNIGPAKPLALPKINTPPNFTAPPPTSKTYKYLDAASCASQDDIVINVDDTIANYKAKSQEVAVNGNGCRIAITGKCSSLVINGSNNVVKLETVSEIVANGDRNQVRWLEGATTSKAPIITNNGSNNDIAKISRSPKAL